jgi:hypothetical protein
VTALWRSDLYCFPDSGPVPDVRTPTDDLYLHATPRTRLGVDDMPSAFGIYATTLFSIY